MKNAEIRPHDAATTEIRENTQPQWSMGRKRGRSRKRKWKGLAKYNSERKKQKKMQKRVEAAARSKSNAGFRCKFCQLVVSTILLATSLHNGHATTCQRWAPVQISTR